MQCGRRHGAPDGDPEAVRPRVCLVLSGGLDFDGPRRRAQVSRGAPGAQSTASPAPAWVPWWGGFMRNGASAQDEIDATMRWGSIGRTYLGFFSTPRSRAFRPRRDDRTPLVRLPLGLKRGHLLLPRDSSKASPLRNFQLTLSSTPRTRVSTGCRRRFARWGGNRRRRGVGQRRSRAHEARRASRRRVCSSTSPSIRAALGGQRRFGKSPQTENAMHANIIIASRCEFPTSAAQTT